MGGFLSKPVVDKESSDGGNEKYKWGACSMQGWRDAQEDAHNCIIDYDVNTSFFAVYDGHGGHAVSQYCSEKLPDYIKNTEAYKSGDIEKALIDGYLGFDTTLTTEDVMKRLREIALDKPEGAEESEIDEEEDISEMYKEASMPIEKVIEKYASGLMEKKKKPESTSGDCSASSSGDQASCSKVIDEGPTSTNDDNDAQNGVSSSKSIVESSEVAEPCNGTSEAAASSACQPETSSSDKTTESADSTCLNGVVSTSEEVADSSGAIQENGNIAKKGKGKALMKTKGVVEVASPKQARERRTTNDLYERFLNNTPYEEDESESESEEEDDKSFEPPQEDSTDDSEDVNNITLQENSDESEDNEEGEKDEENLEDEEEDDEESDNVEDLNDGERHFKYRKSIKHDPGMEGGCTAVVAILRDNELYVANAGDSRCIICRQGEAVPMSFDHKPMNKIEHKRIRKAGGTVDFEGRVNGGLNLSRAIGDHNYKQNELLSDKEQMITALPDVKRITVNPHEDEFMVLACDGIWDCYSNQEVVDFVKKRLETKTEKLSQICEEMFDACLSKHSYCDKGCDNMTAIIVQFKSTKRPLSPSAECVTEKRIKTDESECAVESV